jgi:hypothetical protein
MVEEHSGLRSFRGGISYIMKVSENTVRMKIFESTRDEVT